MLPCQGADSHLWTSDNLADVREAATRCAPCARVAACLQDADRLGASWGAWGGQVRHPSDAPQPVVGHADCDHPRTKEARGKCWRARRKAEEE